MHDGPFPPRWAVFRAAISAAADLAASGSPLRAMLLTIAPLHAVGVSTSGILGRTFMRLWVLAATAKSHENLFSG